MTEPLRVAIVGSGPAGLYAADHLLNKYRADVAIGLIDDLPTPWGLVRAGVAPDHPEKKLIADRLFDFTLKNDQLRFLGNVRVGRDIQHDELRQRYHAVIYATGASTDSKQMGIPGEDLTGSIAAADFVAWYNGHPDYSHLEFDLSSSTAVIVGNGNVSMDVARILAESSDHLARTDIADHALAALCNSRVKHIVVMARRSIEHAAFNNPELEELGHLGDCAIEVQPEGVLDNLPPAAGLDQKRKFATLKNLVEASRASARQEESTKTITLHFLASPIEVAGQGSVQQLRYHNNRVVEGADGKLRIEAEEAVESVDTGLVIRAIGYRGRAIDGLPFDTNRGIISNQNGRVYANNGEETGTYVTGWIRRGPTGVIGTNKKCAGEVVDHIVADFAEGKLAAPATDVEDIKALLDGRGVRTVTLSGWTTIDRSERAAGRAQQRPRVKVTSRESLLGIALETASAR